MHNIEKAILLAAGVACFIAVCFIPREKADKASFVFLLTQFFTWILGLVVVEFVWLDYPVRELAKANATSFIFEYLMLPIITIFFILHYPLSKSLISRVLYYIAFSSSFTVIEYFAERYTLIIEYHTWQWYWTWVSITLVFYIVMTIYRWFYKAEIPNEMIA